MTTPITPQPVQQPAQRPPQQSMPAAGHRPAPQHVTICGIISVVFGALGLVLSFIPIVNNVAAILGFIGAILGIIALVGTFGGKKRGKVLSVVATVLCVLSVVITLAMQSATSKAIDDSIKESKGIDTSQSGSSAEPKSSVGKDAQPKGEQDMEGDVEGLHVKIVSAALSVNDYEGKPTVLVTYEWTNKTTKNNSFAVLAHPQVFQNGKALDTAIYMDVPEGYDGNSYMTEIQPNATATVTLGYVLQDTSPVTVDISAFLSADDTTKVVHTFNLQ